MSSSPLNDILALLARAEGLDSADQAKVLEHIHGVRRSMNAAPSELLGCLDAAATLVGSLPHLEKRAATEVREMVSRLVDLVGTHEREALAAHEKEAELDVVTNDRPPNPHPLSPTPAPAPPPVAPPPVDQAPPPVDPAPEPISQTPELADETPELADETLELVGEAPALEGLDEAHQLDELDPLAELDELDGLEELGDLVELSDIADLEAFGELEELADPQAATEPAPAIAPAPMPTPAPLPTAGVDYSVPKLNDMMLGEVMIQLGFVSKGEVDTALRRMADYGQRFGEALIEIGAATAEDVAQGISLQRLLSEGAQQAQESKFERANVLHGILLGEILVLMGRITRDQLKAGLEHQSHTGSRIGEALVELRFITWNDLDEAICIQHARGGSSELNESSTVVELE